MEKIVKSVNGIINFFIAWRLRGIINKGKMPTIMGGYARIYKLYKDAHKFTEKDFLIQTEGNWGSAFPENISVTAKDNVTLINDSIHIKTQYEPMGIMGKDFHGEDVFRKVSSGTVYSKALWRPKGAYSAIIQLDSRGAGSWDAWWFLQDDHKDKAKIKYRELDMFERFCGLSSVKKLTTSIHRGRSSEKKRQIYNHTYDIPELDFLMSVHFYWFITVVKINGITVFAGINGKLRRGSRMIIGTGIMKGYEKFSKTLLYKPYWFTVRNIKHHILK